MQTDQVNSKHRNDHRPELTNGKPTERQSEHERAVLFNYVLRNLGVSRQAIRFIYVIKTLTVPGKVYRFNDYFLAEHLGCPDSPTCRNYVVNLRKKLKEWNRGFYNHHGTRHFPFVSVEENTYDFKTKKQQSTGYVFSPEFADLLESLLVKVRANSHYNTNWIRAIRETCGTEAGADLKAFGFWKERKERLPRTPEDILGTLLLNWKRLTKKIVSEGKRLGVPTDLMARKLMELGPNYVLRAKWECEAEFGQIATLRVPGATDEAEVHDTKGNFVLHIRAEYSEEDFEKLFSKVLSYVGEREQPAPVVNAKPWYPKSRLRGFENARSNTRQFYNNAARSITGESENKADGLGSGVDLSILQSEQFNDFMADQRERFLERLQKGG